MPNNLEEHIRIAQSSQEYTYAYDFSSIELGIFSPGVLDTVGSLFDYFLPTIGIGSSEFNAPGFQYADMLISQHNV